MTKKALKLALEALENSAIKHPQQIAPRDAAIAAIREALAQPAAQAERQPLTDVKIWDIASDYFDADAQYDGVIAYSRAIEAAHGIKGQL